MAFRLLISVFFDIENHFCHFLKMTTATRRYTEVAVTGFKKVVQCMIASYGDEKGGIKSARCRMKPTICQPAATKPVRIINKAAGAGRSCDVFFIVFV